MITIAKLQDSIRQFIINQEESKTPFIYYVLTFVFIVLLRNFFDTITDTTMSLQTQFSIGLSGKVSGFGLYNIISNTLWYVGLAVVITIILYLATHQKIEKILKLILPGFIVLLSVSFVDTLLSMGIGFDQSYMLPGVHDNILLRWITFSIPFDATSGITPGMKVEAIIVITAVIGYVFYKTNSKIRSAVFGFIIYSAVFFWGCIPFAIMGFYQIFGIEYALDPLAIINFILLLLLVFGILLLHIFNKRYVLSLIRDMDPLRVLHYLFMFFIGIAIGFYSLNEPFTLTRTNIYQFVFVPAAIIFAGIFSLVINGLADKKIDMISNPNRALIDGTISVIHFKYIGFIAFFAAMIYSFVIDHIALFIILLVMGNYFIYSAPPLRLKRVTIFSKFFISLNSLILIILGYYLLSGMTNIHYMTVLAFLGGFTILINFIDLKDYEGDKKEGIKTIPTLIGMKKSQLLFSLLFLGGYISFGVYFENLYLLIILIILGIIQVVVMNRPNYQEKYVFGNYVLTLFIVMIFIFNKAVYIPLY